jgi:hypothetical protein
MIHDTRVIPIGSGEHLAPAIRQFLGDSRGRWEGHARRRREELYGRTPYRGSSTTCTWSSGSGGIDKDTCGTK